MTLRRKVLAVSLAVVLALVAWGWADYRSWRALGPGGVPSNLAGWAQVTWMRLDAHDPLDSSLFATQIGSAHDLAGLGALPIRAGDRPNIDPHPIPHRQTDQHGDAQARLLLKGAFDRMIAEHADLLHYRKSHFELRNDAIWLREPDKGNPTTKALGEVGHVHPSDGSMHMTLSPSDAKTVIEARWGELHTLAGRDNPLPATYMMVYSPRDQAERDVTEQILRAAVAYAAGSPLSAR